MDRRTQRSKVLFFFAAVQLRYGASWNDLFRDVDKRGQFGASCPRMDPKQARFTGETVAWYESAAKIENERLMNAGLSYRVTWGSLVRVAACQVAGLPVEHVIDFAWIREEMKKTPVKGPALKRTRRS